MDRETIKALALQEGFKLKEQPAGEPDLNPYVYHFAERLVQESTQQSLIDSYCAQLSEFTRQVFGQELHTQLMMIFLLHRMSHTLTSSPR